MLTKVQAERIANQIYNNCKCYSVLSVCNFWNNFEDDVDHKNILDSLNAFLVNKKMELVQGNDEVYIINNNIASGEVVQNIFDKLVDMQSVKRKLTLEERGCLADWLQKTSQDEVIEYLQS